MVGRDPAFCVALAPTTMGCWVGHCISGRHFFSESSLSPGLTRLPLTRGLEWACPWRGQEAEWAPSSPRWPGRW